MGRSVSYATGSKWVLYCHPGLYDPEPCYGCAAESGAVNPDCEVCNGAGEIDADYDTCRWRWDEFVDGLRAAFKRAFPSMYDCDEWLGREDHALLENGHAYIGVSEYMGLVSVWCVPKEDMYGNESPLAARWCESIESKAEDLVDSIATRLVRVGTFSNGESLYLKAPA